MMRGFEQDYRLTFWFAALALVLAAFLPGWPLRWRGRASLQAGEAERESAARRAA